MSEEKPTKTTTDDDVLKVTPITLTAWVRNMLAWTYVVLSVVFLGPPSVLSALFAKLFISRESAARVGDFTANWWLKGLRFCYGLKIDVVGNTEFKLGPKVIVSNHRSHTDVIALGIALFPREPFGFVMKRSLMQIPIWGWFMQAAGYVSVDRKKKNHEAFAEAAEAVAKGRTVLIFAEGTRAPAHTFLRFKKGAFVLAVQAQSMVMPVTVSGSGTLMPKKRWFVRPGTIRVHIHDTIDASGMSYDDRDALLKQTKAAVESGYLKSLEDAPAIVA